MSEGDSSGDSHGGGSQQRRRGFWDFASENPGVTLIVALSVLWSVERCFKYATGYQDGGGGS